MARLVACEEPTLSAVADPFLPHYVEPHFSESARSVVLDVTWSLNGSRTLRAW